MLRPCMNPALPAAALLVRLLVGASLACAMAATHAGEVLVAVAANFHAPMQRIAADFKAATGHTAKLSVGPTGRFHAQIVAGGAPFEVLISADDETPRRLLAQGHAVPGSAFTYAIGQLVLWSPRPGFVDDQGAVLRTGEFRKLSIANPKVAPYGQAALQVLRALGLAETLAPKLVTGESIGQAFQFVATGNAELGFVALAQVQQPGRAFEGSMWRVPPQLHATLRQDAVLLERGAGNAAARALLAYLQSAPARAVMQAYGYRF
jgi:molybdate transport system substrate-binding protein